MVERREKTISELEKQCLEDSQKWFGDSQASRDIPHHALALAGEVGEFCNIVKKVERGSLDFNSAAVKHDLAMELTDVFVYTLNLAGMLSIDLAKTYEIVRANNDKRFTAERMVRNGD
jgi:NTP pyrophosphatase (non-canonical NTP hydrolase)